MFSIKLYHFDKKPNSTKLPPAGTGDAFMCNIKTSSSLINPVIEIRSTDNSLLTYNYAYIGPFGARYYFIDDIVFNAGIFSISLSVDVLASYKADILASSQYVQRSASRYNRNIIDTSYLTIANSSKQQAGRAVYSAVNKVPYKILRTGEQGDPVSIFNVPLAQGDFVVGILGDNSTGVQWYAMGYPAFGELLRKAFTLTPSNMTDLQQGTANAIFDPISYIVSAR